MSPHVAIYLARTYGLEHVGYYLSAAAVLTLIGLLATRETKDDQLLSQSQSVLTTDGRRAMVSNPCVFRQCEEFEVGSDGSMSVTVNTSTPRRGSDRFIKDSTPGVGQVLGDRPAVGSVTVAVAL